MFQRFARIRAGMAGAVAATIMLAGCSGAGSATGNGSAGSASCTTQKSKTISFSDTSFQTIWINNAIAEYIVTKGFCYPVKTDTVSSAVANQSLAQGQIDVNMELWAMNFLTWYNQVTKDGEVVDLGPTYDKSTQGWYVPKYMIDGDPARGIKPTAPDLTSVDQLAKYWKLFQDPHDANKGLFINCITSWQCATVNRIKLKAYGLDKYFNVEEPGTAPALDAAIVGAYKKGQPFVAYYWAPTWLLGKYDLVQLKEPAYSDACNTKILAVVNNKIPMSQVTSAMGCAYDSYPITKGVNSGLLKSAPDVVAFLKKMDVGNDPLQQTAAYMTANNATADQAARYFFEHYQSEWQSWLPSDVAQRVKAALVADGAKFSQ